jgi:hypothetical protein
MPRLSRSARLAILGFVGILTLIFFLDYFHNLNWLGGYDWYAMVLGLALLMFAIVLVAEDNRRSM